MDFYKQFPNSALNFDDDFEDLLNSFINHKITTFQLLTTPSFELSQIYKLDNGQLISFISQLRKEQSSSQVPESPFELQNNEIFTTGDLGINETVNGGIKTGELTEVFGESATGKSQFVMQLASMVQLPVDQGGLNAKCVFICTEGMVETKRLLEMNEKNPNGLDDIYVINCNDLETQEHIINVQLPTLLSQKKSQIKLIVIDSISHHIRVELGSKFVELKNYIDELGSKLCQLAYDNNVAIVLTNQISDRPLKPILNSDFKKINYDYQIGWSNGWDDQSILQRQDGIENNRGNRGVSTLGSDWDKFINLKILLLKQYKLNEQVKKLNELKKSFDIGHRDDEDIDNFWQVKRGFKVIYSSRAAGNKEVEFKIEKNGLKTIKS